MTPVSGRVLLATRSGGKLRELQPWFAERGLACDTLVQAGIAYDVAEESLEVHATFEENALAKARWFHEVSGGRFVIAEDSGLEVAALGGAPGVFSKRWSGDPDAADVDARNNALLLVRLEQAAREGRADRGARYVCAAAAVWAGGACVERGVTEGRITTEAMGEGGFGYDPYFFSTDLSATFATVSRDAKAAVSHRGRALAALLQRLETLGVLEHLEVAGMAETKVGREGS